MGLLHSPVLDRYRNLQGSQTGSAYLPHASRLDRYRNLQGSQTGGLHGSKKFLLDRYRNLQGSQTSNSGLSHPLTIGGSSDYNIHYKY